MSDLLERYPEFPNFLLFGKVNQGFIISANQATNVNWITLQGPGVHDHYAIPMSPSGRFPATHRGARGLVRAREADRIIDYYLSVQRNDIDAWVLSPEGMLLWSKVDGWFDPITGPWTFEGFLGEVTPPVQIIEIDPDSSDQDYLELWLICDAPHRNWANNKVEDVTGDGWDHVLTGFSLTGEAPATEFAVIQMILPVLDAIGGLTLDEIKSEFPPPTINQAKVYVSRRADGLMIWNNEEGDVSPQPLPFDRAQPQSLGSVDGVLFIPNYPTP